MDFTEDFIKTNELSDTQVTALTKATNDNEATLKKELAISYQGKKVLCKNYV